MSCKTMSIDLANVPPVPIQIGVAGENSFRTITFDASKWGADYPDATYTVVYRRADGYLYPVLVNASADTIVWSPTETDTAVSGNGQLEVRLLNGETIGKTIIMQTYVAPSLSGDESEPSTPAPDWVNDVAADADRAEAAVSHYPKIVNGVWYVWDANQSDFVSTGISAQGEDGVSPTVTVTAIEGGHRVTITDTDGAHTFDVMDGEGSQGGAVESVNGMTGAVVLGASDVGALPDTYVAPVQSVNGQTGAVTIPTGNPDAVLYTPQSLTPAQQEQARGNIGAGTYTKPSGGIPKTDLASDVRTSLGKADSALQEHQSLDAYRTASAQDAIDAAQNTAIAAKYTKPSGGIPKTDLAFEIPTVPQTAVYPNMQDWTEGKVVDAFTLKTVVASAAQQVAAKADASSVYTKTEIDNKGYQTAQDVQTAISGVRQLPAATASDNGKFLRVVNGAWAAQTGEGGSSVTVDSALSTTSENPVQNKVVKAALDGKADASALAAKQDALTAGQNVTISGNTISADVDSAEIAADVTDWLDANVTPVGSAVVVDSSLSVSGAAADAKVTGDLAKPISDAVALPVLVDVNNFEIGTYWGASSYPTYGSTLNKGTDTNTIRTIEPIYIPSGYTINTHGKLNIRLISVLNSQYAKVVDYGASGAVYTVESTGYYHICFQLVKSNGTISSVESALDGVEISTSPSIAEDVAALKADNAVLGVDGFLLTKYSAFQLGGLSSGNITTSTTRICTTDVCIADEDLNLHINSGFRIGVHIYKADGTFERDSGWIAGEAFYQIPQGKKFRVVMTPVTEYTIYNAAEAIPEMVSNVQCNRLIDEMPLMREMVDTTVYPYATETANHISAKKQAYVVDTVPFDATMPYDSYSIPQDIAVYDGNLFVAHNKTGGKCITIQNADTGALVATVYSEDLNHANVISFGGSFFDLNDPYPLLYVSTENSSQINVFRITNSALTLVKTYAFADVGYYGNHCIDPVNNILYMIGYVQNTYNDGTDNFCIFSAYNLNSEIDNGDDTYSAELMYRRRIPYIMTHQGNTFFGGNLFILSSDYDQHNTKIYVLNASGNIINILSDFPAPIPSRECEGITIREGNGEARLLVLDGSSKLYTVRFKE